MVENKKDAMNKYSYSDICAAMLAGSPYPHVLFGDMLEPLDCNESAVKFFGFGTKEELIEGIYGLARFEKCVAEALINGASELDNIVVGPNVSKEAKVSFRRTPLGRSYAVVCSVVDLTSLRRVHNELIQQDNLLQCINQVASILMMAAPDDFDMAVWQSLQMVGRTVGVDRAYIWENFEKDGAHYSKQTHEWSEGAEPQQGKEFAEALPYDEIPYWRDCVLAGLPLNSPVRMLPDTERSVLEPQGIKSILVIPVMHEGRSWGYIGFDDCSTERFFAKVEEQMLLSGGTLVVSAIIRNRAAGDLKEQIIAAKRASDANESKSSFLAKTSHEIRTPMNAIIGMAELALREEISPAVRSRITDIKHAGDSLLAIINDILDFSKIESGKMEIVPVNYHLSSLMNDVISIMRMRVAKKGLAFTVHVDGALPDELYGDAVRLRQVLVNILDNAVKYTQSGFVDLDVSGLRDDETGVVTLVFAVRDSGAGIKTEDYDKLFQGFVQLDKQKNWGVVGTGLGLTISRSFVHAMGGDISVESSYGNGSTFYIKVPQPYRSTIPVAEVAEPDGKSVILLEARKRMAKSICRSCDVLGIRCDVVSTLDEFAGAIAKRSYSHALVSHQFMDDVQDTANFADGSMSFVLLSDPDRFTGRGMKAIPTPVYSVGLANMMNDVKEDSAGASFDMHFTAPDAKVLVVDDNVTNLKVASGLMAPYLMAVDTCMSGAEALAMIEENRYDIVFMDHMMPEMDGIEATEIIRGKGADDPYYRDVPIVALTANAVSGMQEMFLARGMNGFLSKPIDVTKLHRELERRLPAEKIKSGAYELPAGEDDAVRINGLDAGLGLYRAGGTMKQYCEILSSYCDESRKLSGAMRECIAENDLTRFKIYAHSLKSSSASIGALDISNAAAELERVDFGMEKRVMAKKTKGLLSALDSLVADIRVFLDSRSVASERGDPELLFECLENVLEAVEKFDITAADAHIERLKSYNWAGDIQEQLDAVAVDLMLSDLDMAEERVKKLLAQEACDAG